MNTPLHYEFSDVYLLEHIQRLSRGVVVIGSALLIWTLVVGTAIFIINLF